MRQSVPKDYVRMGQHVCLVCGQLHDSGEILLHKRLQSIPKEHAVTGWGLCPEHKKLHEDGFIALVECDPVKSRAVTGQALQPEDAYRTGNVAHMREEAFKAVFGPNTRKPDGTLLPLVFVEPGVIDKLKAMVPP